MSGTHIAVGVAFALAIAQTGSVESCAFALVGGAVGSVMSDTDTKSSKHYKDARNGRIVAALIVAAASLADVFYGVGVWDYLFAHVDAALLVGVASFAAVSFIGARSRHRTFTHSLLGLALWSATLQLLCSALAPFFAVAFVSHLVLDLLNSKPIQLLYPWKRGFCLSLCRADGAVNSALLVGGIAMSALLLSYRLLPALGITIALS